MGPEDNTEEEERWADRAMAGRGGEPEKQVDEDERIPEGMDVFELDAGLSITGYEWRRGMQTALDLEVPPLGDHSRRWDAAALSIHSQTVKGALSASFWCPSALQQQLFGLAPKQNTVVAAGSATGATTAGVVAVVNAVASTSYRGPLQAIFLSSTPGTCEKAHEICTQVASGVTSKLKSAVIGMENIEEDLMVAEILFGTPSATQRTLDRGSIDATAVQLLVVDNVGDGLAAVAMQVKGRLPLGTQVVYFDREVSDEIQSFMEETGGTWTVLNVSKQPQASLPDEVLEEEAQTAKETGNQRYKNGDWVGAIEQYSHALRCESVDDETRAVYFCNRAASRMKLSDWKGVERDCSLALKQKPNYPKALMRRKIARENHKNFAGAAKDAQQLEKLGECSATEVARLERLGKEQAKKETDEAMAKLKDLGNTLLGNFGLSLDNFKMDQDPSSGGYNIRFEQ